LSTAPRPAAGVYRPQAARRALYRARNRRVSMRQCRPAAAARGL